MRRGSTWLASERPEVSPEAEEFWKMWCEGEKGTHPDPKQARCLLNGTRVSDGVVRGTDGRTAYTMQTPPGSRYAERRKWMLDPTNITRVENGKDRTSKLEKLIKRFYFYRPDLPPDSITYYERLSAEQQAEVDALRRHWMSLTAFKDHLKTHRWIVGVIFWLPFVLLLGVYILGLERVPLTGRWRIILLTPEEEDAISTSLAGANWYRSVINILTTEERPAPPVVPLTDWRCQWVQGVLRRLETAALADCQGYESPYGPPLVPIPASDYPLKPRPRVSSRLHACLPGAEPGSGREHLEIGPPYSLMIMSKEERNAFSYGFGGKGAGGIVVYTGLLDSILRSDAVDQSTPLAEQSSTLSSFLAGLFGTIPARPPHVEPTETQTLHLASVLAHEMGHLLLSHHLETLSQQQVLWPSVLGLSLDLMRAFIWPLT